MTSRLMLVLLIVAEILMLQAMANESEVNPGGVKSETDDDGDESTGTVSGTADQPVSSHSDSSDNEAGAPEPAVPEFRRLGKHYRHHSDKSEAGGGVIIGGLVTAIFAAVFSYIRVTRKRNTEHS